MTVLCNTQDGHFDIDLKEVSSLKGQLVERPQPTMNTLRSWSDHPQAPPQSRPAECHQL